MLLAKYMHFFNLIWPMFRFYTPLKTCVFRGYRKRTLFGIGLNYKILNILLILYTLSTEIFAKKTFRHHPYIPPGNVNILNDPFQT